MDIPTANFIHLTGGMQFNAPFNYTVKSIMTMYKKTGKQHTSDKKKLSATNGKEICHAKTNLR